MIKHLAEEAAAWAAIGGKPSKAELELRAMPLLDFLELISITDFKFRYTEGDVETFGIEKRHEMLKFHIAKLKAASGK